MENLFLDLITSLLNLAKPVISAFSPLITGLILAYILNPAVVWFEGRLKSRGAAVLITFITVAAILSGLIYGFIVLIVGALPQGSPAAIIAAVGEYFSSAIDTAGSFLEEYIPQLPPGLPEDAARGLQNWLAARFSLGNLAGAVSAFTEELISLFIGIVVSVYLLKDKEFFISLWEKFMVLVMRQHVHGIVSEIMGDINIVITTFIKGALVDSIIVAFLSSLALTITGTDFAVIIGIMAGLFNIIPYFGSFIGMALAFIVALFTGGPFQGLLAAAALIAVQQLDANYVYPKIVGASTGLHPLFVLLAVSILGSFMGITGMLLAVPIAGIIQVFVCRWAISK